MVFKRSPIGCTGAVNFIGKNVHSKKLSLSFCFATLHIWTSTKAGQEELDKLSGRGILLQ